MTLPAGTVHALKGVSIADSNASGSFTAKISDSTGLLRTTSVSGVTEQGEGSTSLTLIGTLTAINAELSSLTYQAGKGAGSDWLWTSANDAAGVQGIGHTVVTVTPAPKVAPRGVLAVAPLTPQVVAAPIGAASPIAGQTVPTTVAPVQPSASGTQPISIQTIDVWAGGVSLVQPGSENSTFLLHDASTLNFATVVGGSGTIKFLAPTATLEVQATGPFKPAILGFAPGDTIDAAAVLHEIGTMLNFVSTDTAGTLSVSDGTHSASFALTGTYAAAGFHMAADQHGGTAITYG